MKFKRKKKENLGKNQHKEKKKNNRLIEKKMEEKERIKK